MNWAIWGPVLLSALVVIVGSAVYTAVKNSRIEVESYKAIADVHRQLADDLSALHMRIFKDAFDRLALEFQRGQRAASGAPSGQAKTGDEADKGGQCGHGDIGMAGGKPADDDQARCDGDKELKPEGLPPGVQFQPGSGCHKVVMRCGLEPHRLASPVDESQQVGVDWIACYCGRLCDACRLLHHGGPPVVKPDSVGASS